jgi:hypothetical protein
MDSKPISSSSSTSVSSAESVRKEQTPPHQRITAETKDKAPMREHQLVSNARNRQASPHRLHPSSTAASGLTPQPYRHPHSPNDVPVTEAGLQEVFDAATVNFERRLNQKFQYANDQFAASLKEVGTKLTNEIDARTQTASVQIQRITDSVEENIEKLENINQSMKGNIETLKSNTNILKSSVEILTKSNQNMARSNKKASDTLARIEERQEARRLKRDTKKTDSKS